MELSKKMVEATPYGEQLLMTEVDFSVPHRCTMSIVTPSSCKNYTGTVHGGWIATAIDETFAQLVTHLYGENVGSTTLLNITYLEPIRPKHLVRVTAECVQEKACGVVLCAKVYSFDNEYAHAQTEWRFRKNYVAKLEAPSYPVGTLIVREGVPHALVRVCKRTDPDFFIVSAGYGRTMTSPYLIHNELSGLVYAISQQEFQRCLVAA